MKIKIGDTVRFTLKQKKPYTSHGVVLKKVTKGYEVQEPSGNVYTVFKDEIKN